MKLALSRVLVIAQNTLLELIRQRTLNILLLFGLVVIGAANFFGQFTFDQQFKFIKDFSLGVMSFIGSIMAIVTTAQLLPAEIENRTLFTILSKPVRRWEFLIGKYLGITALLSIILIMMSLVFGGVLFLQEKNLIQQTRHEFKSANQQQPQEITQQQIEEKIRHESRDPMLLQAILLILVKLILLAAIALTISTFASSMIFTVIVAILLLIAGHLQPLAREIWLSSQAPGAIQKIFLALVTILIPDFNLFNLSDDIVIGNVMDWRHGLQVMEYGLVYTIVMLLIGGILFSSREL